MPFVATLPPKPLLASPILLQALASHHCSCRLAPARPTPVLSNQSMALLPLFLRQAARFAASVAGRPAAAATVATALHRAGALPRNRALQRLVRDDEDSSIIARLVVAFTRCLY